MRHQYSCTLLYTKTAKPSRLQDLYSNEIKSKKKVRMYDVRIPQYQCILILNGYSNLKLVGRRKVLGLIVSGFSRPCSGGDSGLSHRRCEQRVLGYPGKWGPVDQVTLTFFVLKIFFCKIILSSITILLC